MIVKYILCLLTIIKKQKTKINKKDLFVFLQKLYINGRCESIAVYYRFRHYA